MYTNLLTFPWFQELNVAISRMNQANVFFISCVKALQTCLCFINTFLTLNSVQYQSIYQLVLKQEKNMRIFRWLSFTDSIILNWSLNIFHWVSTKFKLKGTQYLKVWLKINVLKTLWNENWKPYGMKTENPMEWKLKPLWNENHACKACYAPSWSKSEYQLLRSA